MRFRISEFSDDGDEVCEERVFFLVRATWDSESDSRMKSRPTLHGSLVRNLVLDPE
jgi:hypothetical protein